MKKLILLSFCSLFSLFIYAAGADNSSKIVHADEIAKICISSNGESNFLLCCSSAPFTTSSGMVITCSFCAESCSGPNGSEARVADCITDLQVLMPN